MKKAIPPQPPPATPDWQRKLNNFDRAMRRSEKAHRRKCISLQHTIMLSIDSARHLNSNHINNF